MTRIARLGRRGTRNRVAALVGVALLITAGVVVLTLDRGGDTLDVATGPSAPPPAPTVPPLPPGRGAGASETVLATGPSWRLFIGGPDNGLCLSVELPPPDSNITPSVCSGFPPGVTPQPEWEYIPMVMADLRAPAFVVGRMPPDVESVEVASFGEATFARGDVITGPGGPFYVVEIPHELRADVVVGRRRDGSTVRYSAFCQRAPRPDAEVAESYVGSPQHLAAIDSAALSAPPEIRGDLLRFHAYLASNVKPTEPDSQLTENWPSEIRSAADRVQQFIQDNCY